MYRRALLIAAVAVAPGAVLAQPARTAQANRGMFGQDFDSLPAQERERVRNAFRRGSPDLDDAGLRQRWDAMTPGQREEALRTRDRDRDRSRDRDRDGTGERDRDRNRDRDRDRVGRTPGAGAPASPGGGSPGGGGAGGGGGGGGGGR